MESRLGRLRIIARTISAERVTLEVAGRLRDADVDHVILKGPVFAQWLYEDPSTRTFTDSDFLIDPSKVERTEEVLISMGFDRFWDIEFEGKKPWVERRWVRSLDDANLDLHRTLFGVGVSPADAWRILSNHRIEMDIKGHRISAFDDTANALHVVLHALQHGEEAPRPIQELDQAIQRLAQSTWSRAADLADELHANEWLSSGLRLHPEGVRIAEELGLSVEISLETALRSRSAPFGAETLAWLSEMKSWRARTAYVVRSLFPPVRSMRTTYDLARRGWLGLTFSYLSRWVWLASQMPKALRALRAAQKASKGKARF